MSCYNHPNAPTAAVCKHCGLDMCGMCTKYLDDGEYCEKCAVVAEADAYMKSRSRSVEHREAQTSRQSIREADPEAEALQKSHDKDRIYIWGGIGGATLMLFVSMGIYAFPNLLADSEVLAAQEAALELEACRLVFEEIGYMLSNGNMPDASMRCDGTNVPNVISRGADGVRVSHPNPAQLGLEAMYVTSNSHEVVMVRQG